MTGRFRVGIIGTGENARDHGRACRNVEQAELVAICDISAEALQRFGDEFDVANRYTSPQEMPEPGGVGHRCCVYMGRISCRS